MMIVAKIEDTTPNSEHNLYITTTTTTTTNKEDF